MLLIIFSFHPSAALNGATVRMVRQNRQFWGRQLHHTEIGRRSGVTNPTSLEDGYV